MKNHLQIHGLILAMGLRFSPILAAHETEQPTSPNQQTTDTPSLVKPVFVQNIAPAAVEPVKVVDAFSAAIQSFELDAATELLDPQVLVLESGGSERSREEFMGGHAVADANIMQSAQQQLRYRQAHAEGELAWVGTESDLHAVQDGKPIMLHSAETMLLKNTAQGWKNVHIHWSSRPQK